MPGSSIGEAMTAKMCTDCNRVYLSGDKCPGCKSKKYVLLDLDIENRNQPQLLPA